MKCICRTLDAAISSTHRVEYLPVLALVSLDLVDNFAILCAPLVKNGNMTMSERHQDGTVRSSGARVRFHNLEMSAYHHSLHLVLHAPVLGKFAQSIDGLFADALSGIHHLESASACLHPSIDMLSA